MSVVDKTTDLTGPASFAARVEADSGANLLKCYQCQKCSTGCPVAARADVKPHELVRLVQLGQEGEVLASRMIWDCTSCQTCFARCPQGVDISAMNDALRRLSRAAGAVPQGSTVPAFNDLFLRSVRKRGRIYEMGLMTAYKLRTGRLLADVGKFPMMLWKGKLPLRGKKIPGKAERKALFDRAARARQAPGDAPGGENS